MIHESGLGRGWSLAGAALAIGLLAAPASGAPSVARGEQFLPVSQEECLQRAHRAFVLEGWKSFGAEGTWVGAFKGIHSGYITCNVATSDQVVVNIFVASQAPEGDVPGNERVRLQERMAAAAPGPAGAPTSAAPAPAAPPTATPQAGRPPATAAPAPRAATPPTATPRTATPTVSAPPPLPPPAVATARPATPAPTPGPVAPKGTDPTGAQWDEWEGHYQGVWTRRGTTNVWDASWGSVKAVLTVTVLGNQVRVQRRHGSDGNICDYQGVIEADGVSVQGSFNCANGATNLPWRAVIRR